MLRFREEFPGIRKVFLVVIHAETPPQVARNTDVAFDNGADGIFLVNHSITYRDLIECYSTARKGHRNAFIGLNFLGLRAPESLAVLPATANGIWLDDAGYQETAVHPACQVERLRQLHRAKAPGSLLFGGVAHKGNAPVHDPYLAAHMCAPHLGVLVTTGPGTGRAANPEKVRAMKRGCGTHPLALASGVTAGNAHEVLPWVECVMVNSGISRSFTELDPQQVFELARVIHSF